MAAENSSMRKCKLKIENCYTFLILANFNLFEFSAAILEKGLFFYHGTRARDCIAVQQYAENILFDKKD